MSQKTVAAYGTWSSPISAEMVAQAGVRLSAPWLENGVTWWLEGRATEAGRVVLVRRGPDGEQSRRRPGRLQRADLGARVRRWRVLHPRGRRVRVELRRPAPVPRRSRRRARADHPRGAGAAPPLRRRARHPGRRPLDRRTRATRRERPLEGRRERARRPADRRLRRAARDRRRSRLLLRTARLA